MIPKLPPLPDVNNPDLLRKGSDFVGNRVRRGDTPVLIRRQPTMFDMTNLLWYVSDTSVDLGDLRITVADGVLYAPADPLGWPNALGSFSGLVPMKQNAVTGTEEDDITDGDMLFLKVKWRYATPAEEGDPAFDETYLAVLVDANGPIEDIETSSSEAHTHLVVIDSDGLENSTVDIAVELLATAVVYDGYEWVKSGSEQTDTATETYYKIATFVVDVDVGIEIQQHILGCPLTAQPLIYTYGRGTMD